VSKKSLLHMSGNVGYNGREWQEALTMAKKVLYFRRESASHPIQVKRMPLEKQGHFFTLGEK
jgi:hypothetical protein